VTDAPLPDHLYLGPTPAARVVFNTADKRCADTTEDRMLRWITLAKSWNVPTRTAIATIAVAGGLGMKMIGFDFFEKSEPPSSQNLEKAWRPYIETCIAAFGPQRSMFESKFPVAPRARSGQSAKIRSGSMSTASRGGGIPSGALADDDLSAPPLLNQL
jgi:hypothetical protein